MGDLLRTVAGYNKYHGNIISCIPKPNGVPRQTRIDLVDWNYSCASENAIEMLTANVVPHYSVNFDRPYISYTCFDNYRTRHRDKYRTTFHDRKNPPP
jgi:hypothetical protein